jgi:hypothetical protein
MLDGRARHFADSLRRRITFPTATSDILVDERGEGHILSLPPKDAQPAPPRFAQRDVAAPGRALPVNHIARVAQMWGTLVQS